LIADDPGRSPSLATKRNTSQPRAALCDTAPRPRLQAAEITHLDRAKNRLLAVDSMAAEQQRRVSELQSGDAQSEQVRTSAHRARGPLAGSPHPDEPAARGGSGDGTARAASR
jgi:hypothetical protein